MSTTETTRQEAPVWTLGERLYKAREHAGITRDGMANRLGVSERTIRNYENEHVRITRSTVIAYSSETGVPIDWFDAEDEVKKYTILGSSTHDPPTLFSLAA